MSALDTHHDPMRAQAAEEEVPALPDLLLDTFAHRSSSTIQPTATSSPNPSHPFQTDKRGHPRRQSSVHSHHAMNPATTNPRHHELSGTAYPSSSPTATSVNSWERRQSISSHSRRRGASISSHKLPIPSVQDVEAPENLDLTSKTAQDYLHRITGYSLSSLLAEPSRILDEYAFVSSSLSSLCHDEYRTFIAVNSCSDEIEGALTEFEDCLGGLMAAVPELEEECRSFIEENKVIQSERAKATKLLDHQDQLLDLLEIPTLVSTCVANGYYAEALELSAHVTNVLVAKHGELEIVRSIESQVKEIMKSMECQLLQVLRGNVKLPTLVKTVGYLGRMHSFSQDELRVIFLESREANFRNLLSINGLDIATKQVGGGRMDLPTASTTQDPTRFVRKYVDLFRENVYDTISQYVSIFLDPAHLSAGAAVSTATTVTTRGGDNDEEERANRMKKRQAILRQVQIEFRIAALPHPNNQGETHLADEDILRRETIEDAVHVLVRYATHAVSSLLSIVSSHLPLIADTSSLSSLMTQLGYCALSFSRVGMDFTPLLADPFQRAVLNLVNKGFAEASDKLHDGFNNENRTGRTPSQWMVAPEALGAILAIENSSDLFRESPSTHIPPQYLANFPPLAIYMNACLTTLNSLRLLAPISLFEPILSSLEANLRSSIDNFLSYARLALMDLSDTPSRHPTKRPAGLRRNTSMSTRIMLNEAEDARQKEGKRVLCAFAGALKDGVATFLRNGLVNGVYGQSNKEANMDETYQRALKELNKFISEHGERQEVTGYEMDERAANTSPEEIDGPVMQSPVNDNASLAVDPQADSPEVVEKQLVNEIRDGSTPEAASIPEAVPAAASDPSTLSTDAPFETNIQVNNLNIVEHGSAQSSAAKTTEVSEPAQLSPTPPANTTPAESPSVNRVATEETRLENTEQQKLEFVPSTALPPTSTTVSAPGKVLLAGGYLVLDPNYTGTVVATSARFFTHIQSDPKPESRPVTKRRISVKAAQFTDPEWTYDIICPSSDQSSVLTVEQVDNGNGRNKFVEISLRKTLLLIQGFIGSAEMARILDHDSDSAEQNGSLNITIAGDNAFYSQAAKLAELNLPANFTSLHSLPPFNFLGTSLGDVHKTGLGSSAALVTSFVGSLLIHFGIVDGGYLDGQPKPTQEDRPTSGTVQLPLKGLFGLDFCHNVAQWTHNLAQGKLGSGFDVSASSYGSQTYRRYQPEVLAPLMDREQRTIEDLNEALSILLPSPDWTNTHEPVWLPRGLRLLLADCDKGSNTPSFVSKVLKYRSEHVEESKIMWDDLASHNRRLGALLSRLSDLSKSSPSAYDQVIFELGQQKNDSLPAVPSSNGTGMIRDTFDELRKAMQDIRFGMKRLGEGPGVPVEPDEQTRLLDACIKITGVIGGGVPGAGGYDAVFLLVTNPDTTTLPQTSSVIKDVEALWLNYTELRVSPLDCGADQGGLRHYVDSTSVKGLHDAIEAKRSVLPLVSAMVLEPEIAVLNSGPEEFNATETQTIPTPSERDVPHMPDGDDSQVQSSAPQSDVDDEQQVIQQTGGGGNKKNSAKKKKGKGKKK